MQELRDGADGDERRAGAMQHDIESAERRIAELEREAEQAIARRKQVDRRADWLRAAIRERASSGNRGRDRP